MWPGVRKLAALLDWLVVGRAPERPPKDSTSKEMGQYGEDLAVYHLRKMGYKILARNVVIGRGEIDVLALDAGTLCFVEVKARTHDSYGGGVAAVTRAKRLLVARAAGEIVRRRGLANQDCRFDVVDVSMPEGCEPEVQVFKGAFAADGRLL